MTHAFVALAISAVFALTASAQTVNLTGTWVLDEKRSGSAGHEGFVSPVIWTVTQEPEKVIVQRQRGERTLSFDYLLTRSAPGANADPAVVSPGPNTPGHRAYWEGSRLILVTLQDIQGKTVSTREVLSLSGDGRELSVDRVVEVEHGYTMKGAQNFNTVKDVFAKK
jgi:hypothetical protein